MLVGRRSWHVGVGRVDHAVAVVVDVGWSRSLAFEQAVAVGVGVDDRGQREGADDEQVVVVVAFQAQLGLVGVDDELVVAGAALGDHRALVPGLSQPRVVATDPGRRPAAAAAPSA